MAKQLPLRLKDLIFPLISVKAIKPTGAPDSPYQHELNPASLSIGFRFRVDEDGSAIAGMRIKTKAGSTHGDGAPYEVDVEAFAEFEVIEKQHKDDKALLMRRYAAASSLVGAIREQIAALTSRGPWKTAFLPMIPLEEIAKIPESVKTGAQSRSVAGKSETRAMAPRPRRKPDTKDAA